VGYDIGICVRVVNICSLGSVYGCRHGDRYALDVTIRLHRGSVLSHLFVI